MSTDGWRTIDGVATAWYAAPSLTAGASLLAAAPGLVADLRHDGVRVRADAPEVVSAAAAAARGLGLVADPAVLQRVHVVVESTSPAPVEAWWARVLGGDPGLGEPPVSFRASSEARPLRDRWHLDVVRPGDVVEAVGLGAGAGPYGVRHADPDGNEADLVPGERLTGDASDWTAVFATTACYRVAPSEQQALVEAVASVADAAGFPLLVGVRPGLVVLDTGKDRGDAEAHGLDLDFATLAAELQVAARDLGAVADLAAPCFVQTFLDAADVDAVRAFWLAALGYLPDPRRGLTDVVDPRRLDPVLVLQPLDPGETDRRRQRNRIHLELVVPADAAPARVSAALAAGGRVPDESHGRTTLLDPEGNELVVVGEG